MKRNDLIFLLNRTSEKARRVIVSELETHGVKGIVPSHGDILALLFSGEQFTMKVLAEKIHRTQPTVTVLVDKLVNLGYVTKEKSSDDSRITFIRLTEKGLGLQPCFSEVSHRLNTVLYKGLSGAEVDCVFAILGKINRNLGK